MRNLVIAGVRQVGKASCFQQGGNESCASLGYIQVFMIAQRVANNGGRRFILPILEQALNMHIGAGFPHRDLDEALQRIGMNQIAFDFVTAPAKPLHARAGYLAALYFRTGITVYELQCRQVVSNKLQGIVVLACLDT